MKQNRSLLLASASKRRVRILKDLGVEFESLAPQVDESDCSLSVENTVIKNAKIKNEWAVARYPESAVISADTAIEFHGSLIGKPSDMDDARSQLRAFSGQTHKVLTGVCCSMPGQNEYLVAVSSTVVFRDLEDELISQYFSLVDPLDKAGSYDIGSHGDMIIERHEGSMTNIIGLSVEVVVPWLKENGLLKP